MQCATCHSFESKRASKGIKQIIKKSTIPKAGNGLFAERDYRWGEYVTSYNGIFNWTNKIELTNELRCCLSPKREASW